VRVSGELDVARRYGAQEFEIPSAQEPHAFALMIAKIGLAFAAAEGRLSLIKDRPFVAPAILGQTDDIGKWMGTITEPVTTFRRVLHRLEIHEDRQKDS